MFVRLQRKAKLLHIWFYSVNLL